MLQFIYAQPLIQVVLIVLITSVLWGALCTTVSQAIWNRLNRGAVLVCLVEIVYLTVFSRTPGTHTAEWRPFASFAAATQQPELYRAMLMNMFLFFPLGVTLSNALPPKMSMWRRIALTTFLCCVISAGIEFAQCFLFLGVAETDDVICNTLGSFFGACSLLIAHLILKWQNHSNR
ncbi:MAG: VanZ family protein [Oscillospiraceae bacterium]|nr:VanZ family protein [Oscillospiraceae bacterium]